MGAPWLVVFFLVLFYLLNSAVMCVFILEYIISSYVKNSCVRKICTLYILLYMLKFCLHKIAVKYFRRRTRFRIRKILVPLAIYPQKNRLF